MPADEYWRLDNGQVELPMLGHDGPEVTHNPGSSYSIEVWFVDSDSPAGEWVDGGERWRTLRSYQAREGEFALGEPMGGGAWYSETHDGEVPSGSLLVALRPPATSAYGIGMWALISKVEDMRTLEDLPMLSVELTVLAPLPDYPSFAAVRNALERPGIGLH